MNPQFEGDLRIKTGSGFKKLGFSDLLIDEIVAATIRVNYGQDLMVQKFVGMSQTHLSLKSNSDCSLTQPWF